MANQDDDFGMTDEAINGKTPPSQKVVDWFHGRVSTTRDTDVHHRIGTGDGEVAKGSHTHDGKDSMPLFTAEVELNDVTAASTPAQMAAAINALNAALRTKGAGGA